MIILKKEIPQPTRESLSPQSLGPAFGQALQIQRLLFPWRWRWNQICVCVLYADALGYLRTNKDKCSGLSFVIHPGDEHSDELLVVLDFDRAFDEHGKFWPEIQELLDILDSFAEYSRSGKGIHIFLRVKMKPFKNLLQVPVNEHCAVDILCRAQIAVTGRQVEGTGSSVKLIPASFLESLHYFKHQEATIVTADIDFADWWSVEEQPLTDEHQSLIAVMKTWPTAVKGHGRSKVSFAAACEILRKGVVGWPALRLLECVPTTPPLTVDELKHKLEDAYAQVVADGTFNNQVPEFEILDSAPVLPNIPNPAPQSKPDKTSRIYSLNELLSLDIKIEFAVDRCLVEDQITVIGGREKCFKTGVACDLLLSLVTGTKFLGEFEVLKPKSCIFFTAEIGLPPAQDLCRRILKARGLRVDYDAVYDRFFLGDFVPSFYDATGDTKKLAALDSKIHREFDRCSNPQVACFDPLYLAMGGASVGDMYEIGPILNHITEICRDRGIWPIFCHHAKKDNSKEFQPMDLGDLYGSGVSAFARQWILLSHSQPFLEGQAKLYARLGGSASGDLNLWDLEITEGTLDAVCKERRWEVSIEQNNATKKRAKLEEVITDKLKTGDFTHDQLKKSAEYRGKGFGAVLARMQADGLITQQGDYFKLVRHDSPLNEEVF